MFEKARGANVVKYKELDLQVEVNGSEENPIFTFLKSSLPSPSDSKVVVVMKLMSVHFAHEHKKTFLSDLFSKGILLGNPKFINWAPVKRNDISWNFEKFLIGPDGTPVRRYSRYFPTSDIEEDIRKLISEL